jgi:hypothetical protein
MFFGTQALPRNMGAYVDTQNWHDEGFLDNLGRTGQTSPLNRVTNMAPFMPFRVILVIE